MFGNASEFLIYVSSDSTNFYPVKNYSVQSIELNRNDVNRATIRFILSKTHPLFVVDTTSLLTYENQFVPVVGSLVKITRDINQSNEYVVFIGEIISIVSEEYNKDGVYICIAQCEGIERQLKFYNLNRYKYRVDSTTVITINSPPIFFMNRNGDAFGGSDDWSVADVFDYFSAFESLNGVIDTIGLTSTVFRCENPFNNIFEVLQYSANEYGALFSFSYSQLQNSFSCTVKDIVFATPQNINISSTTNELQFTSREGYHGVDFRFVCPVWVEVDTTLSTTWGDSTTMQGVKTVLDNLTSPITKRVKIAATNQIVEDTIASPQERTEYLRQNYSDVYKEYQFQNIYQLDSTTAINLNDFDFYLYELSFYDHVSDKPITLYDGSILVKNFFSPGGTISVEGSTLKFDLEDPTTIQANIVYPVELNTILGKYVSIDHTTVEICGYIVPKTHWTVSDTWVVSAGLNKYLQFDLGNLPDWPTNDDIYFFSTLLKKYFAADRYDFDVRSIDSSNLDYLWGSIHYVGTVNEVVSDSFPMTYRCVWDEKTNNYVYELKMKGVDENSMTRFLINKFFLNRNVRDFNLQKEIALKSTLSDTFYAIVADAAMDEYRNHLVCGVSPNYGSTTVKVAKPVSLQAVQYLTESTKYVADATAVDKRRYVALNETQQITPPYSLERGIKIQLNSSDLMITDTTSREFIKFIDTNENGKSWAKVV